MSFRSLILMLILTNFLIITLPFQLASYVSFAQPVTSPEPVFQKGMSFSTYADSTPNAFGSAESDESLRRMRQIGVEWVAINVVEWYQTNNRSTDIHKNESQAPTDVALAHAIQTAHSLGMKVMLKPLIDLEDGRWRGEIQASKEWFQSYTNYLVSFAEFAQQQEVEMLCIGTEYRYTTHWMIQWMSVISEVRFRFNGTITYAATWDELRYISWWVYVDYIGINAYFPLSNRSDPSISEMKAKWENITDSLESVYLNFMKPIIFPEIGYLSTDGTNKDPSNYKLQFEKSLIVDLQEQADCYEAAFSSLWNKGWFYGFYWWYWQTNPNAGGLNDKDYTPQSKPAQDVITHWYSLNRDVGIDLTPYFIMGGISLVVIAAIIIGVLWRKRNSLSKVAPKG